MGTTIRLDMSDRSSRSWTSGRNHLARRSEAVRARLLKHFCNREIHEDVMVLFLSQVLPLHCQPSRTASNPTCVGWSARQYGLASYFGVGKCLREPCTAGLERRQAEGGVPGALGKLDQMGCPCRAFAYRMAAPVLTQRRSGLVTRQMSKQSSKPVFHHTFSFVV